MTQKYTANDKRNLIKMIKGLTENEYIEIFKIISNDTDKYTENNNGIFINLNKLKDKKLEQIFHFLEYCQSNNKKFEEDKKERKNYTDMILTKDDTNSLFNLDSNSQNNNNSNSHTDIISKLLDSSSDDEKEEPMTLNDLNEEAREIIGLSKMKPDFY